MVNGELGHNGLCWDALTSNISYSGAEGILTIFVKKKKILLLLLLGFLKNISLLRERISKKYGNQQDLNLSYDKPRARFRALPIYLRMRFSQTCIKQGVNTQSQYWILSKKMLGENSHASVSYMFCIMVIIKRLNILLLLPSDMCCIFKCKKTYKRG